MISSATFTALKSALDESANAKDHLIAEQAALANGLTKEDLTKGFRIQHVFSYEDEANDRIELEWRCYDQSGPFQNLPDMNKIELRLISKGQVTEHYHVSYED